MSSHLQPSLVAHLNLRDSERIQKMQESVWIGYPRAQKILEHLERLFNTPKKSRMPNALLVGPTNNGKTSILNEFVSRHPFSNDFQKDSCIAPVLAVQAPPTPDESALYDAILFNFSTPIRKSDHPRNKRFQAIRILQSAGTKVLIIDEIQHILAGDSKKQHTMLNVIKHLGNELQIPIVAAGVETALNAIQIDYQLSNRFEPLPLSRWKYDDDFRRLLASFEKTILLKKPSGLVSKLISETLFLKSEGIIGELSNLLIRCAEQAIQSKTEQIDTHIINTVDWIIPSERRRKAETSFR
jgi:Cdc6-like AAA superfamily ATPase